MSRVMMFSPFSRNNRSPISTPREKGEKSDGFYRETGKCDGFPSFSFWDRS